MGHRLFLAIKPDIDKETKNVYYRIRKILSGERVKFYPLENLMLIIRYLGDIPTEFLSELNSHIAPVINTTHSFELSVEGVDIYPYDVMPRVLWFRLNHEPVLENLARRIEQVVKKFSGHEEDFAFYPHVSFARIRFLHNMSVLDEIKKYSQLQCQAFRVSHILLIESIETNKGNIYKTRNRFALLRDKR